LVPPGERAAVADLLLRVLGALPVTSAVGDQAARRDVARFIEELRGLRT
jgi:hypothetical protein